MPAKTMVRNDVLRQREPGVKEATRAQSGKVSPLGVKASTRREAGGGLEVHAVVGGVGLQLRGLATPTCAPRCRIAAGCTSLVPMRCRCSTNAGPVQHHCSTTAVLVENTYSMCVVLMYYRCSTSGVPV